MKADRVKVDPRRWLGACALATALWIGPTLVGSQPPATEGEPAPDRYDVLRRTEAGDAPPREAPPESEEDRRRRSAVVARVDGVAITVGEIEDLLTLGATEDDVQAALEASIRRVRLTHAAERRGLAHHPDVASAERRALVEALESTADFTTRSAGSAADVASGPAGGARDATLDALVVRLRAAHVRDVTLDPLYPLRLDPRPRDARAAQPTPPTPTTTPTPTTLPEGFEAGSVERQDLRLQETPR